MCGVTVVDAESFWSTWHERDAFVHDHCLRYLHNYALFYQLLDSNFFTHRNICYLERSHLWPPGLFSIILNLFYILLVSGLLFCNLLLSDLYTKNTKNIYFTVYLSLSDLTFASNREGIDNPFMALGASCLIVCVGIQWFVHCLLLDWYLGSQTEGNTYSTLLHHPFHFKEKTNASSRGSKKDFWHHCRGDLRQVKPYQVPIINSSPLHYIIRHSPLIFLSPTSKTIFEKICLFFAPLPFVFFACFLCARVLDCLLCHDGSREYQIVWLFQHQ